GFAQVDNGHRVPAAFQSRAKRFQILGWLRIQNRKSGPGKVPMDRMGADATEPVFRVAVIRLAPVHDRMPIVAVLVRSPSFNRLRSLMTFLKEVIHLPKSRQKR